MFIPPFYVLAGEIVGLIYFHARDDGSDRDRIVEAVLPWLLQHPCRTIYVDLFPVELLSAQVNGVLVLLCKRLKDSGRKLILCDVKLEHREHLEMLRLDRILPIHGPLFSQPESLEERSILEAIQAEPKELVHRRVYADWLEDREDPRAELVRLFCQSIEAGQSPPQDMLTRPLMDR